MSNEDWIILIKFSKLSEEKKKNILKQIPDLQLKREELPSSQVKASTAYQKVSC